MTLQTIAADLTKLPRKFDPEVPADRVETGVLQINDDWPGVFIRGDNAAWYAMQLDMALTSLKVDTATDIHAQLLAGGLMSLRDLLLRSNIRNFVTVNDINDLDDLGEQVGC